VPANLHYYLTIIGYNNNFTYLWYNNTIYVFYLWFYNIYLYLFVSAVFPPSFRSPWTLTLSSALNGINFPSGLKIIALPLDSYFSTAMLLPDVPGDGSVAPPSLGVGVRLGTGFTVIFGLQRKTDRLASVPFSPKRSIVSYLSL